jgi:hypothetical protein
MDTEKPDQHPYRTLGIFLCAGVLIFCAGLFAFLFLLTGVGGYQLDPSVQNFYFLMAVAGAIFGLERWMAYEAGPINPFHDR